MEGWINLHRRILDSAVFASEKRLKIWIWLLCKANYKDRFVKLNIGKGESVIEIKRGQLIFGRFKAEEEIGIDGSTIYKILHWMQVEEMIKIESNSHYTILTINNYDTFQTLENEKVTTIEQPLNNQVTANEQPSNTPKKDNKDNKDNNILLQNFEGEKIDYIESIIKVFSDKFFKIRGVNYEIVNKGKERGCAAKILKIYKKKYPDSNSETTLSSLGLYFEDCLHISDDWLNKNMGLPIIINKFNEINNIIRNGNKRQKNGNGATPEEVANVTAKHFASDRERV